jgi:hypothetical protein
MESEQVVNRMANKARKIMRACKRYSLVALMLFFIYVPMAPALTINTQFIGGEAPANAVGKGNLQDIVNTAARIWSSVYSDSVTLTLYYGWDAIGSAGTHILSSQGGNPNREISGTILFDNTGSVSFYLDPTPDYNEEYRKLTEESQDLGGGHVNVARVFSKPLGEAVGHTDLLSVVLHEIGHALGMSSNNISFVLQSGPGVLNVSEDLPFSGTLIPLAYNNAGVVAHFDVFEVLYGSVMAGINSDERRLPSELDILANAQISSFSILSLRPQQIYLSDENSLAGNAKSMRTEDCRRVSKFDGFQKSNMVCGLRRAVAPGMFINKVQ